MESNLQSLGKLPGDTNAQSGLRITAIETCFSDSKVEHQEMVTRWQPHSLDFFLALK